MKNFIYAFTLILLLSLPAAVHAQFQAGKSEVGPSVGLSFLGSTPQFGLNYEYGMKIKNFGIVGIGGIFRYWSYNESFLDGKWSYTDILIGAQGNYHFNQGDKFDPWIGIILAYDAGSVSWKGPGGNFATPASGGLYTAFQGGARYWISPTIAVAARLGFGNLGYSALDLGVDFKF